MLRVFLVEDESTIRETLRDTVPWAQCGYEFAGEAVDGEMALPLIRQAIDIGVERFLLKPITKNSLMEVLGELKEKIEGSNYAAQFHRDAQEYEQFARRRFFEQVGGASSPYSRFTRRRAGWTWTCAPSATPSPCSPSCPRAPAYGRPIPSLPPGCGTPCWSIL